ncbi:MAG: PH domain-containing protein [Micromonosporaceae bacterium]|jgi:membrane protein YdbS with pleckstrin-like domain|nr:PH domain-containing protein [Micromonosporaceae bacterium]
MGSGPDSPVGPDDPDRWRGEEETQRIPRPGADDDSQGEGGDGTGSFTGGPDEAVPGWDEDGTQAPRGAADDEPDPGDYGPPPGPGDLREPPPSIDEEELVGLHYAGEDPGMPIGPRRVMPLEDEPSSVVARYLFPTERYRGEWKRHWIHLQNVFLIAFLATLLLGFLTGFTTRNNQPGLTTVIVLIWLFVVFWVAWRVADWYFDRFILTNKRVMVVNGIITRRVAMMPLLRVTDMKYEQSPLGRMLNYGTFVLESAGQEQALREIKHLPNPNELYLRVVEEMYEPQAVEARLGRSADAVEAEDA